VTLYAIFETIEYIVRFFAADGVTILQESAVLFGAAVTAPADPVKTTTAAFDYVFLGWSETTDRIESDLDVQPLFTAVFRPDCVALLPGVDTIHIGDAWINPGVTFPADELTLVVIGSVAAVATGRTTIEYRFFYADVVVYRLLRIVNVLPAQKTVVITLKPGIATLPVGSVYVDPGATTSKGDIVAIGTVDGDVSGVYSIVYTVEYEGITYHKTRYVFVVDAEEPLVLQLMAFVRKEDDIDA
ncbi:MAG: hypothetical protein V1761_00575, partial [bacterium]